MSTQVLVCIILANIFQFFQIEKKTYYVIDKGIYIEMDTGNKITKVPFKENLDFYFSLKNDSVALIQEIYNGKPAKIKEHQIAHNYDTVYIKRYSFVKGKKKLDKVEKIIFKKVY